jgi:hypothetical protein
LLILFSHKKPIILQQNCFLITIFFDHTLSHGGDWERAGDGERDRPRGDFGVGSEEYLKDKKPIKYEKMRKGGSVSKSQNSGLYGRK